MFLNFIAVDESGLEFSCQITRKVQLAGRACLNGTPSHAEANR